MIEERRKGRSIPIAELKKRLNRKTRDGPRKRTAKPGN